MRKNMNKVNYQVMLDTIIKNISGNNLTKTLLLHSCCAPCSSYVLSYLSEYFDITVLYYNPNITDDNEYQMRKMEQIRLINELNTSKKISILDCDHEPEKFLEISKGLETCHEGGERCFLCYNLRLQKTAEFAQQNNFDYFCTTLSISPLKNAAKLNEIGEILAQKCNVEYLPSDFKKKEGYKKSIELSKKYHLYRQNYCGCPFSKDK